MESSEIGASIEANKANLTARKMSPREPEKNPLLESIVYPFKLENNSKAIITRELDPKDYKISSTSMLNLVLSGTMCDPGSSHELTRPIVT